jgi:hypothetical protein
MSEDSALKVKIGNSSAPNARKAVEELAGKILQPHMHGTVFFCSPTYDLDRLGECIKESFPCPVIGCTTAGELTSEGYHEGTLVGASLGGDTETAPIALHPRLISPLGAFSSSDHEALARSIKNDLQFVPDFNQRNTFGLLLIDGMSMLEEPTTAQLHRHFQEIPVIGGSAGDGLNFGATHVFHDGQFINDAAVFTVFETILPFTIFKTQHFVPTERKLVITESDPENRRVIEVNGKPAAEEYARVLGLEIKQLSPMVFSSHPVMLRIGGEYYVRSIQKVNEDGSLTFFCAIDNGLVLTVAQGVDLVENLKSQLSDVRKKIPNPELVIGCDCILRRLEVQEKDLSGGVHRTLENEKILGFSTYGEQFNAVHVNQTLTGVAIGGTP